MYLTFSKFTIASYIIHIFSKNKLFFFIKKNFKRISLIVIIIILIFIIKYSDEIINLDIGSAYSSFNTIAEQLLKIESYTSSFSFFPDDTNKIFEIVAKNKAQKYHLFFIEELKLYKIPRKSRLKILKKYSTTE